MPCMASGRSGGYILSKRPPPSPDKSSVGGFKQRRTEGLTAEGANLITGAQRDVGPLEVCVWPGCMSLRTCS